MEYSYTCLTLQRVVLPVVLVVAALCRPVGISFVYLLMFFISPFIPIATTRNFRGSVTPYLIILLTLSTLLLLGHIALQVIVITLLPDHLSGSCEFTEQLLRHVGLIDFRHLNPVEVVKWLTPEVLVFLTSLSVFLVTKKFTTIPPPATQVENGSQEVPSNENLLEDAPPTVRPIATEASAARRISTASVVDMAMTAARKTENTAKTESPNFEGLIAISPFFCLGTLFFAAALRPSVPGGFYFLIFLLSGSYWATYRSLNRGFAKLMRCVMVILVMHIICVVAYQTPWMQQHVDHKTLESRLLSLEPLVTSTCAKDIRVIVYNYGYKLDSFLSPLFILLAYYTLAVSSVNLMKPRIVTSLDSTTAVTINTNTNATATAITRTDINTHTFGEQLENGSNKCNHQIVPLTTPASRGSRKDGRSKPQRLNVSIRREPQRSIATEPTEMTPLVRSTPSRSRATRAGSFFGGRMTNISEIAMHPLGTSHRYSEDVTPSIFDQISYGIISVGSFIYQNSYIFTNILMMAWSIVFHSWLTFVFLLWANVLWMIPNQRKAMMRSSPFIVIYALLLLVAQYVYGMDLTNVELPSKVNTTGINLGQIGLKRPQEHGRQPCVPLFIKTSFLLMFWVTLRQFCKEKSGDVEGNPEMMGPLQLSSGSPVAESPSRPGNKRKTSKFLKKFGGLIKNLLVRLWIWLLVLVIFVCAIAGKRMTGFRICYMALFLFFLLVFQSSSRAWLHVMYGFWLFLIFYAMSILILIYTYQFDKFNQYWQDYLNISETLQSDIGLERFKTKDLLLNLLSPTIIVILTVIQVHYFHKRFISSLTHQQAFVAKERQPRRITASSSTLGVSMTELNFEQSLKDLVRAFFKKIKNQSKRLFKNFKGVFWRFLELHIIKLVYITAFVCSIKEVCLLHIPFVFLCAFGLISRTNFQIFLSRFISFVVTLIILAKMIYQITYLDHDHYNVQCDDPNISLPYDSNNAVWFGLRKASEETDGLMDLLRKYIVYMVVATLHAVVTLRQYQMRSMEGRLFEPLPKVLFPNVRREDAEKNLEGMVKYIFNYGFYKIGFEISLITLAITVAYRQDIVAVGYVCWLFVLLWFGRGQCRRIWSIFQMFIVISILVQYVMFVGLPPSMCMKYAWENIVYSESIQIWALLPGGLHINHASKLVFDFILLLMVNRQKHVFNLESRFEQQDDYPGGSNKSVVKDIANLGHVRFQNPTRDFLSNIRNYLDIFKNGILCGFYWITLAVVFLAGTNISDLLALGYLVGAFVFLWQGSDFYLRPIHTILKRWNWLIAYNVANIVIKTCLQMAGCMFLDELTTNCCWLVHILGISCAGKTTISHPLNEAVNKCPDITSPVVLVWDTVCFAFLIFQLRIFKSHYFCHIINDTQANSILASRGAELIEDLRQKQIEHRQEHEKAVLYKIKRKMEKIRATQQKMLRPIDRPVRFDDMDEALGDEGIVLQKSKAPLAEENSFSFSQISSLHTSPYSTNQHDDYNDITNIKSNRNSNRNGANIISASAGTISDTQMKGGDLVTEPCSLSDTVEEMDADELGEEMNKSSATFAPSELTSLNSAAQQTVQPNRSSSDLPTTMVLDDFLDGNRSSLCSVPYSDLNQSLTADSDDSLRIFSEAPVVPSSRNGQMKNTSKFIRSPILHIHRRSTQRQSSGCASVSWNETTVSIKCPTKEDSTKHFDDVEFGYPIPGSRVPKRKEIKLHPQAVRAGDYYMFEDMDEKFELDLIEDEADFLKDQIEEDEKKLTRRKTTLDDKAKPEPSTSRSSETAKEPAEQKPKEDSDSAAEITKQTDEQDKDTQSSDDDEITSNPIIRLLGGFLVSLTIRLNHFSRNYRYVNKILTEEKKVLKESRNFMRLSRFLATGVFNKNKASLENENGDASSFSSASAASNAPQPPPPPPLSNVENATNIPTPLHTTPNNNNTSTTPITNTNSFNQPPFEPTPPHQPHDPQDPQHVVDTDTSIIEMPLDTVDAKHTRNEDSELPDQTIQRRPNSDGNAEIKSMISLNPGLGGTAPMSKQCSHEKVDSGHNFDFEDDFTSRDHNIMVELMVATWYAVLSNTDIICYIVVFINMVLNASLISLPLPIMVFLWGTLSLPRPTKTFWVTLIAYTQAIVLIKCIFQYKLIWANYNNIPNQPLAPEKIIGVELNPHYASYDLLLLLVLFLHRFILKSQGLWKSEYKEEILENDRGDEEGSRDEDNTAMVPSQSQNTDNDTTQQSEVSVETDEYVKGMSQLQRSTYFSSLRKFFFNLLKKTRLPTDVYALMFLCDFINFFVLLFGFTAFGSHQDGGVQEYLAENKVPVPFLILLLVQFVLLIIDRALYLRKALLYKIIFHFILVIGIHICMFFVVPAVTERRFYSLAPPIIFYFIKCFYLLFSSYQIKCGYPKRILGNFLTRSFSMPNMISFKVYMMIPFLYELRTILDWVCTDTTMTLFDWLKMEDIFANIFFIKCSRQMETDFPAIRAEKKVFYTKLLMGGTIILLIVIFIWGPLCLFALGNAVGHSNVPHEVSISIQIGPYGPIYQTSNRESIYTFDDEMYAKMKNAYLKNKGAVTFFSGYEDPSDIAGIRLAANSPSLWSISPPDKDRLLKDLENGVPLIARFTYELTRTPPVKGLDGTVHSEVTFTIDNTFNDKAKMVNMLKGVGEEEVELKGLVPKFIKVSNSGDMDMVRALMPAGQSYRPLVIKMKTNLAKEIWWEIHESCKDTDTEKLNNNFYTNVLSKLPLSQCDSGIVMYTFNDKKFPSTFSFLTAGGIIGLYTTFVLLASRVLKSFIAGQNRKIMFEDLPYVDRVLQLCLDIYLVREALEFALEEDLFAKLLFLYRSPETMIKWTRPKEETTNEDEADTESLLSRNTATRRQEQL